MAIQKNRERQTHCDPKATQNQSTCNCDGDFTLMDLLQHIRWLETFEIQHLPDCCFDDSLDDNDDNDPYLE